jgi:EAL domain-containing protein (putative c-di-GMP-specific phosphodiesterase class I)/CheY-like chemotaxis protein
VAHRVLLVDDDLRVTEALRRTLRGVASWEVSTANSAREALVLLEQGRFDAVISDERMPEMSGSELLREVRQRWPDTVRIILTGEASLDSAIRAINEAEIYRFLTKPCHTEDMVACVESALRAKSERDPAQADKGGHDGELARAFDVASESIWIAFQPIVSVSRSRVFGYEALMRPDHPQLRSPLELLAAAERLGRTIDLDHLVTARVAQTALDAPPEALLFVNLHPCSFGDSFLFSDENPLLPVARRVVLEITERSSLAQIPDIAEKIASLREAGFRIAVDDLGTGYSGLTSLVRFKPEFVKFDKELVSGIHASSTRTKLVRSLEQLCRELGIRTIAEGVEEPNERDALIELGCDLLQGYLFGRPAKGFSGVDMATLRAPASA